MNQSDSQAGKDVERRQIDRALARLEEAVSRCREEDVRDGIGVFAALEFLALRGDESSGLFVGESARAAGVRGGWRMKG